MCLKASAYTQGLIARKFLANATHAASEGRLVEAGAWLNAATLASLISVDLQRAAQQGEAVPVSFPEHV